MPKYSLNPLFPNKEICIELMTDVQNAADLKESTINGCLQACLINPEHIMEPFQILVAANKALHNEKLGKLKTRSIYSELLFNLSPTNKINNSMVTFGIDNDARDILVVVFGNEADTESVLSQVQGTLANLESLLHKRNEAKIRKAYKLNESEHKNILLGSVLTAMAVKDVK